MHTHATTQIPCAHGTLTCTHIRTHKPARTHTERCTARERSGRYLAGLCAGGGCVGVPQALEAEVTSARAPHIAAPGGEAHDAGAGGGRTPHQIRTLVHKRQQQHALVAVWGARGHTHTVARKVTRTLTILSQTHKHIHTHSRVGTHTLTATPNPPNTPRVIHASATRPDVTPVRSGGRNRLNTSSPTTSPHPSSGHTHENMAATPLSTCAHASTHKHTHSGPINP